MTNIHIMDDEIQEMAKKFKKLKPASQRKALDLITDLAKAEPDKDVKSYFLYVVACLETLISPADESKNAEEKHSDFYNSLEEHQAGIVRDLEAMKEIE